MYDCLRNEDPQGTTYSPSAYSNSTPHRDCVAHCLTMEDLGGDAQVEVEGWPVNSAVELTMIRCTSVDKVRNGWGIEAAVLD